MQCQLVRYNWGYNNAVYIVSTLCEPGGKIKDLSIEMSSISQFFILSPRGDVIIRRDFLGNVPKQAAEIFFRTCKFWTEEGGEEHQDEAPPVFSVDGVTYLHTREGGLQLVCTTLDNVSPSFVLEFLRRMCIIIKDYCGLLTEVNFG